jgi:hypothetical protein
VSARRLENFENIQCVGGGGSEFFKFCVATAAAAAAQPHGLHLYVTNFGTMFLISLLTNGEAHNVFDPIVGLMFIRLCTTSKCNYFTYNTSLYTREEKRT